MKNPNIEVTKYLVSKGADVNVNENGMTLLHVAAMNENVEFVKFLLSKGCKINPKSSEGMTPLHVAAVMNPNVEVAKFLVSKGADTKAKDKKGRTPFRLVNEENTAVVEYLSSLE